MSISYANRGSHLEQLIQYANSQYQNKGLARIDKFPTPIDPERVSSDGKVYGHYARKSTVDYIGTIKTGVSVCFDCKETADSKKLPLSNIHQHQIDYMKNIYDMNGYAFLIVCFTSVDKHYRLAFRDLYEFWLIYVKAQKIAVRGKRADGTASIPIKAFTDEIKPEKGFCLHYLKGIVD